MKIALTFYILFFSITMNAQQSLDGIWNIGNDNTKIKMTEVNGVYEAKIISSDNTKVKIGSQFLKNVKSADGGWKGKLYNAKKGKWYDATFKEGTNELQVTVKAGFMSKTLKWKRE